MRIVMLFCALLGLNGVAGMKLHLKVFYKENEGEKATKSFVIDLPIEGNGLMRAHAVGAADFRRFFAMEEETFTKILLDEITKHKVKEDTLAHWMGAITSNEGETPKESSFRTLTSRPSFRVLGDTSSLNNPLAAYGLVDRVAYAQPNEKAKEFELVKWKDTTTPFEKRKINITYHTVFMLEN